MMIIGGALVVFVPAGEQAPFMNIGGMGILFHQAVGAGMAFLGFLVFIAGLAASPPREKAVSIITHVPPAPFQPVPRESEVLVICPECGAHVSSKSKFCPECGEKLGPKRGAKSHEAEEGKAKAPELGGGRAGFCMYCGTELPEDSNFCPECGKKVKRVQ